MSLERVLIEDQTGNGAALWAKVDTALDGGHEVWLHSPLLSQLAGALGKSYDGRRWLVLEPRRESDWAWSERLIRLRDVILSASALAALSWLFAILSLAVKLSSPGPVFYRSSVVGKGRARFIWSKFRSMTVMSDEEDLRRRRERYQAFVEGRHTPASEKAPGKLVDERRVTAVGRFIRKHSLDELPQLWDVFRGRMSLVGPRPCSPDEAEMFAGWRSARFEVAPGLTGVWQVFGRGRVGFDETAAMDVYYLYARSFSFDLYLILKTVLVMLTGEGGL